MASISAEQLNSDVREFLRGKDLSTLSSKSVRKSLELKYEEDLTSRKKEIDSLLLAIVNEQENDPEESSSDDDSEEEVKIKKEEVPSPKRKSAPKIKEEVQSPKRKSAPKIKEEVQSPKRKSAPRPTKRKVKRSGSDDEEEPVPKTKKKGGYTKELKLSDKLAAVMGKEKAARHEAVKFMWAYVKENNLKDPSNGHFAILDESLQKIFGVKKLRLFGMMKHLGKHFLPDDE